VCGIICWYPDAHGEVRLRPELRRHKLLLDRKKIRRWAKWIYLALAIVFALGFLLIGVGNGQGGGSFFDIFNSGCSGSTTDDTQVSGTELQTLLDTLATDPTGTDTMLKIAAYYEDLFKASQKTNTEHANNAIEYLNKALETDPSLKAVYLDLAKLYIDISSFDEAAKVLNEATVIDPDNPDVYFYLGRAQKSAGRTGEAILAWQKYLELVPADSRQAGTISQELEKLMTPSTTTTVAPTTTTSISATTTTVAASTTTTK
jgi:tetratricopeptide (TPR) repeat protein